jgi:hypothetical protein
MLAEAQALSLREVGIPSGSNNTTLEPPRERRRRERSRETSRDSRRSRDDRRSRSRQPAGASPTRAILPPRAIEHQSSLRSLLSSSEIDSEEVDEDLVRHVLEDLVSEGVDLTLIGPSQEEEITERIAEAVRRRQSERHAERQRERRERRERLAREGLTSSSATSLPQPMRSPLVREEEVARRRPHGRTESGTSTPQTAAGPPISRPGLIDAANRYRHGSERHQRSSSQGSSRSARRLERPTAISTSARPSYNDAERLSTSDHAPATRRRQSDQGQRSGVEARQQFRNSLQTNVSPNVSSPRGLGFNIPTSDSPTSSVAIVGTPAHSPPSSTPAVNPFQPPGLRRTTDPANSRQRPTSNHGTPPMVSAPAFPRSTTDPVANESRSRQVSVASEISPILYTEPQISCKHCGKAHLEHDLHYHCSRCDDGDFDLCHRCYRAGKGCKHWFGFGWTAWARYERDKPEGGYPPGYEQPHVLSGHRYRIPLTPLTESPTPPHVLMSEDDPKERLEEGVFCDTCKAFCNACYWKCDYCNEGDWGFCNDCVNQGKHCTHPLLPVAHQERNSTSTSAPSTPKSGLVPPEIELTANTPPRTPKAASFVRGPDYATIANLVFRPLNFTTLCDICRYSIPPSNTRYHCLKCKAGDYDICMACYHKLNVSGRITKEDGINGWRKCPRGHRMVVVGFEDRDGGQRRMVVRDLVGGYTLKEDSEIDSGPRSPTAGIPMREWKWRDYDGNVHNYRAPSGAAVPAHRFPPDGGVGLRLKAKWNYWPEEGVKDELGFPRHAEIREATDINGDWYWGVYCGVTGLLPASFVVAV